MELERVTHVICIKAVDARILLNADDKTGFFDKLLEIVDLIYSVVPPDRIEEYFLSALKTKNFIKNLEENL